MHFEFLLEALSAEKVLNNILPQLITKEHTYRCIIFQGKNDLLKKLPAELRAYKKWIPHHYKIVILIDRDDDNCHELKSKLQHYAMMAGLLSKSDCNDSSFQVISRIAIEELEAWFFGDPDAIRLAYLKVSTAFEKKSNYRNPDNIVNTWETLEKLLQQRGYFKTGLRKNEVAHESSKNMQPLKNRSKSFQVFREGISACIEHY